MADTKATLYLETTIPSYLTARFSTDVVLLGHQHITREWWANKSQDYEIFISEAVVEEASQGDADASRRRIEMLSPFTVLTVTEEIESLAMTYLAKLSIPQKASPDALHLAVASVYGLDYLLTWNCKHLAIGSVKKALPQLNAKFGYSYPIICTPEELFYENEDVD